ncbi:hypothetical protein GE09DRAFT_1293261 [Coniochaeta sp. 2T2.1]|nr:hypothetical protein GE09DRAFT_1293261 [Coniochaeta sp. 2T2.1]
MDDAIAMQDPGGMDPDSHSHSDSAATNASSTKYTPESSDGAHPHATSTVNPPWGGKGNHDNTFDAISNAFQPFRAADTLEASGSGWNPFPVSTTGHGQHSDSSTYAPIHSSPRQHKYSVSKASIGSSFTASSNNSLPHSGQQSAQHSRISSQSTLPDTLWSTNQPAHSHIIMNTDQSHLENPSHFAAVNPAASTGQDDMAQGYAGYQGPEHADVHHASHGNDDRLAPIASGHVAAEQAYEPEHDDHPHDYQSGDEEGVGNEGSGEDDPKDGGNDMHNDSGNLPTSQHFGAPSSDDGPNGYPAAGTQQSGYGHSDVASNIGQTDSELVGPAQNYRYDHHRHGSNNGGVNGTTGTEQPHLAHLLDYQQPTSGGNSRNTGLASLNTGHQFLYGQPTEGGAHTGNRFDYSQPSLPQDCLQTFSGFSGSEQLPHSPSDVVLIKRGDADSVSGESQATSPSPFHPQHIYPPPRSQLDHMAHSSHTRSISAPNPSFAGGVYQSPSFGQAPSYNREAPQTYRGDSQGGYGPAIAHRPRYSYPGKPEPVDDPTSMSHARGPLFHSNQALAYFPNDQGMRDMHHHNTATGHFNRRDMRHGTIQRSDDGGDDDDDDDRNGKYVPEGSQPPLTLAPEYVLNDLETPPRCMYKEHCDTDSALRKAISHIFGRNKICTRQIPENIWIHLCRKHYQRCRYRNTQEYAKLQCRLIIKQIERVSWWSDKNQKEGKLGVLSSWTLSVRKREQKRRQQGEKGDGQGAGKKRPYAGTPSEPLPQNPQYKDPHAVPEWLLEKCEQQYKTHEAIEICEEILRHLEDDSLRQIPDIELLPSITHDPNDEAHYKRYERRRRFDSEALDVSGLANPGHRRVQSDALCYEQGGGYGQQYGGIPGVGEWYPPQDSTSAQYSNGKRRRIDDFGTSYQAQGPFGSRDETPYNNTWAAQVGNPLPLPVLQRPSAQSAGLNLDPQPATNPFIEGLRQPHQRSASLQTPGNRFTSVNSASSFGPRPSGSHYQQEYGSSAFAPIGTQPAGNLYSSAVPTFSSRLPTRPQDRQQLQATLPLPNRQGHSRNQSTPNLGQSQDQMYGSATGFNTTVVPAGYPPETSEYEQARQYTKEEADQ